MRRSTWLLAGVCTLGVLLGWWFMRVMVVSENDRPALVPRIQSLPAFSELPALAAGKRDLVDSLESPGGPLWVLLGPDPENGNSSPLVCGFPRGPAGAVLAPECSPVAAELKPHFRSARFAVGGQAPIVVLPDPSQAHGVRGLNARSGAPVAIEAGDAGLSAHAERGTRLVRAFQLEPGSPKKLVQASPREGSYTGPVSGYAATRAPAPVVGDVPGSVSSCVTPAGYIQARDEAPATGAPRSDRPVTVAFYSRGDVIAEVTGRLPNAPLSAAPFACDATHGLFTWLNRGGSLSELSCSPDSCTPSTTKQSDVDDESVLGLGRAGSSVVLLWRDAHGEPLVRLGAMNDFAHSPTAPLWKAGSREWQLLGLVSTGQSLVVFVQGQSLKAIQIYADGKLEALAPQTGAG